MEQNITAEVMDKLTKVCLCKGISRATIKNAIKNGNKNIDAIKKTTGAGSGSCCGKRCIPKIENLMKEVI